MPEVVEVSSLTLDSDVEDVMMMLSEAKRPVLMLGSGVRYGKAMESLESFIKKYQVPIVCENSAVDIVGKEYDLFMGDCR